MKANMQLYKALNVLMVRFKDIDGLVPKSIFLYHTPIPHGSSFGLIPMEQIGSSLPPCSERLTLFREIKKRDQGTPMSETDRRTDGRKTYHSI